MGQDVNLARKVAVQNVGCVLAYFCGGHKNNFPVWFRSSFKLLTPDFPFHLMVNCGYLVVTCGYLVVTSGHLIATTGYFWLLLVTSDSSF